MVSLGHKHPANLTALAAGAPEQQQEAAAVPPCWQSRPRTLLQIRKGLVAWWPLLCTAPAATAGEEHPGLGRGPGRTRTRQPPVLPGKGKAEADQAPERVFAALHSDYN